MIFLGKREYAEGKKEKQMEWQATTFPQTPSAACHDYTDNGGGNTTIIIM